MNNKIKKKLSLEIPPFNPSQHNQLINNQALNKNYNNNNESESLTSSNENNNDESSKKEFFLDDLMIYLHLLKLDEALSKLAGKS